SFDQCKPQIPRRIINPIKVTREFSFGRRDHNAARVRELFRLLVPQISKSNCLGEALYVCLIASKKMPTRFAGRPVVCLDVSLLLLRREVWRLLRIETDGDDFKLLSRVE